MSLFGNQTAGRYRRDIPPRHVSAPSASVSKWVGRAALLACLLGAGYAVYAVMPAGITAPGADTAPEKMLHHLAGRVDQHNQCYFDAVTYNGTRLTSMFDSGSSMTTFGLKHLSSLGINPKSLKYNRHILTVSGSSLAAEITLHELRIGDFVLHEFPALVAKDFRDDEPLIGASVLKFMQFHVSGGACSLSWS
jgi:clan AA aspartic protease (TIGR02281 family)